MCSQDILDDSSWGLQNGFFGFSLGGYPEGGGSSAELMAAVVKEVSSIVILHDFNIENVVRRSTLSNHAKEKQKLLGNKVLLHAQIEQICTYIPDQHTQKVSTDKILTATTTTTKTTTVV